MDRWIGKIAVVTGASAGIGNATIKTLVNEGMTVIGLARREDRLKKLQDDLKKDSKCGEFHFFKCDISDLEAVKQTFLRIEKDFQRVHVLVNCAGIIRYVPLLTEGNEADMEEVVKTNLMGTINCIKQSYRIMKSTGEECHIINISSVLGNIVPAVPQITENCNLYPSTKFALRAAGDVLRHELRNDKNFRVSNISPGLVKTEMAHAAHHPFADEIMNSELILQPEDIALSVKFVLEVPRHAHVTELTVIPTGREF